MKPLSQVFSSAIQSPEFWTPSWNKSVQQVVNSQIAAQIGDKRYDVNLTQQDVKNFYRIAANIARKKTLPSVKKDKSLLNLAKALRTCTDHYDVFDCVYEEDIFRIITAMFSVDIPVGIAKDNNWPDSKKINEWPSELIFGNTNTNIWQERLDAENYPKHFIKYVADLVHRGEVIDSIYKNAKPNYQTHAFKIEDLLVNTMAAKAFTRFFLIHKNACNYGFGSCAINGIDFRVDCIVDFGLEDTKNVGVSLEFFEGVLMFLRAIGETEIKFLVNTARRELFFQTNTTRNILTQRLIIPELHINLIEQWTR